MLWWQWVIFGVALLIADIALINIYYLLWFGLGALIVGVVVLLVPTLSLTLQITLFGVFSAAFLIFWLIIVRPKARRKSIAAAKKEIIGASASVVRFANGSGTLRLQKPIGGNDVWQFTSSSDLRAGDAVKISTLDDNGILQVAPSSTQSS